MPLAYQRAVTETRPRQIGVLQETTPAHVTLSPAESEFEPVGSETAASLIRGAIQVSVLGRDTVDVIEIIAGRVDQRQGCIGMIPPLAGAPQPQQFERRLHHPATVV